MTTQNPQTSHLSSSLPNSHPSPPLVKSYAMTPNHIPFTISPIFPPSLLKLLI